MKTIRLEGRALDIAKDFVTLLKEGEKRLKQLDEDRAAVEGTIQKEASAKMKEILNLVGLDLDKVNGSVDTTYLKDHGLAFVQYRDRQDNLAALLESVVAGAVAPQESVQ